MYAIVNIIYGVPLMGRETRKRTTRGIEVDEPLCLEVARDYPSDKGFISYYSGNADETPMAFGIDLDSFDEASGGFNNLSSLKIEPTPEQKEEYQRLFDNLKQMEADDEELKGIIEEIQKRGDPRVFFLWSTS